VCTLCLLRGAEEQLLVPRLPLPLSCSGGFVLQELCELGRNPMPGMAVKVLIYISWEKPDWFAWRWISYREAAAELEGLQKNSCSDRDERMGQ